MNLIDAQVIAVHKVWQYKNWWFVTCTVSAYGRDSETDQMFETEDEARALKVGDTVQI